MTRLPTPEEMYADALDDLCRKNGYYDMPGGQDINNTDPLQTGPTETDPVLGYVVSGEFHSVEENDFPVDNVGEPQVTNITGQQRNLTNTEITAGEVHS